MAKAWYFCERCQRGFKLCVLGSAKPVQKCHRCDRGASFAGWIGNGNRCMFLPYDKPPTT